MFISKETKKFILDHIDDDVFTLGFRASRYPEIDMPTAVVQIEGRQKAKSKLPSWYSNPDVVYPPHLALEQCSSETTAAYKAELVGGNTLVDLTGGLGVDSSCFAKQFDHVVYVERQERLCQLAAHNFVALGLHNIETVNADAIEYVQKMNPVDVIYVDPARRDSQGGKVFAVSDCEPDIVVINDLLLSKAHKILVKLSPMLDVYAAMQQLKYPWEVHIVSVGGECKELLLLLDRNNCDSVSIHCVNLNKISSQSFVFHRDEELSSVCYFTSVLSHYLYEPNASVLKAGAFKVLAVRFGIEKLHPNSHLYTSDKLVSDFPGKVFKICGYSSFNKKDLNLFLKGMKKANICVRNFPVAAAELHKRFHLSDGGNDFLFATTLQNGQHVIIRGEKIVMSSALRSD
ncbi:MAG: SAM-dependent methyltransferase [Bacteroidales bacterium]|nr:SAM-dependent methyltransferase [Bacteroidales bacterium]